MNDPRARWQGGEAPDEFLELAPCGLLSTTPDGTILAANGTFFKWTGYTRPEVVGARRLHELFTRPCQIYYHSVYEPLLRLQGFAHEIAIDILRRDGRVLPVFVNAVEKRRPDGSVELLRVAVLAANDRRKYERELMLERRRAEDAVKAKADFLAMFAHEIRNALTAVGLHVELLEEHPDESEQTDTLSLLRASVARVLELLNGMLEISKLDAGKVSLQEAELELVQVLQAVVHTMAPLAKQKGLALEVRVDPELPERLRGDPFKLDQVLTNLVGNAIKFTERGAITIGAQRVGESDMIVRFWVSDTGMGIPAEHQQLIFDAYVQADANVAHRFGGTGLGLAIASQLVELQGGRLSVTSEPGRGSTFEFQLRLEPAS